MGNNPLSSDGLRRRVGVRFSMAIPGLMAMFFLPAGTLAYWEAWVYLAILLIPMMLVLVYLFRNDPELLERRMRMREREADQRLIIRISYLYLILTFSLPGFDRRFGWSDVPIWLVGAADILVLLGYYVFFLVLRENRYVSRIIEVEEGQSIISSGPYAVVRHPMYQGVSLLYTATPLALGSYWALIPSVMIVPLLAARIRNEESVLLRELEGYAEYSQQTRYRLLPGVW